VDSYEPDNSLLMTIFGFGRDGNQRNLSEIPKQFTIGLVDTTTLNEVMTVVHNAYKPLNVTLGAAEERAGTPGPTPTSTATRIATPTSTPAATATVGPPPTPSAFIFLPVAVDTESN
jgi:hypothetical protein